jgi:hypothetical protein
MGDSDKSIHRREDPAPYEKIIVNPIEKDRKDKEEPYTGWKYTTRFQVFATLVSFFKKILNSLSLKDKDQLVLIEQQHLLAHLLAFRTMLFILSSEDQSHNPEFTQKLTELWHKLQDDCNSLSYTRQPESEVLTKINFFITQIKNYPPNADHTLGYYLTEYAGKEWIPFPFMEMLQTLHEESQAHPAQSHLNQWISLINDILGPAFTPQINS